MFFKKLLKSLRIIEEVSNKTREVPLGRGFFTARRLNPWHPLSYVTIVLVLIVGIIMFGIVGFWKEVELRNPFKWD